MLKADTVPGHLRKKPAPTPKRTESSRYSYYLKSEFGFVVHHVGPVAQWLEQGTHNPLVGGSNPSGPTRSLKTFVKEVLRLAYARSGFRLRAPTALTPAKRLKFKSLRAHQIP
jgi:hypothetical protein